jgi:hypothetical protein
LPGCCQTSCKRKKCYEKISEERRGSIFTQFWGEDICYNFVNIYPIKLKFIGVIYNTNI